MEIKIDDICRYLDFLVGALGYYVTLHGDFVAVPELVRYNFHLSPYCTYIKTVCGNGQVCAEKQYRILEKCNEGAFFGVCHAGVGEYVYPVSVRKKTVGFVSVSGYQGKEEATAQSKARRFAEKNGIIAEELLRMRDSSLRSEIPEKSKVDTVIHPLVLMLESYLAAREAHSPDENDLYAKLLRYVTVHYDTHLTMSSLAACFHCSVSTLSHLFKKQSGMSLSDYIGKLRLDEAQWLLTQSSLSVAEIAESLGYGTPAYFSAAFKKRFGITPKDYRRQGR